MSKKARQVICIVLALCFIIMLVIAVLPIG